MQDGNVLVSIHLAGQSDEDGSPIQETSVQKMARAALIMRDGNEIQRLSIVRSIPALMTEDADECLFKLIPTVQDALRCSAGVGLELHLAASDAYKEMVLIQHHRQQTDVQSDPSCTIDLGLCSQMVKCILHNVETHDAMASSAWLDALLDVVDLLPICLLRSRVLPMAAQRAQQLNSPQARLLAARLVGRLAPKLSEEEVKNEIVPLVQALCQDCHAAVRACACQQLPLVSQCLQQSQLQSLVLPLLIEFSKDDDETVKRANLETVASLSHYFDQDTREHVLVPLLSKLVDGALQSANGPQAVAKTFGLVCCAMDGCLNEERREWVLERFCQLASMGTDNEQTENKGRRVDTSEACRRNVTTHLAAVCKLCVGDMAERLLLPVFKRLCQDDMTEVRVSVAIAFHELARSLGQEAPVLIDSFVDLVYSGDPDVIGALTANLSQTLACIYSVPVKEGDGAKQGRTQLTRILLACNRLIRNGSNWRAHQNLLSSFGCISQFVSCDDLQQSFVPMIKEETVNARAVPCRVAAASTLVKWTGDLSGNGVDVSSLFTYCKQSLAYNRSCHKRALFLDACRMFIQTAPPRLFVENLLECALGLVSDPVRDIRLKLCQLLPMFKSCLSAQSDCKQLQAVEDTARKLMESEQTGYASEVVNRVREELTRAPTITVETPSKKVAEVTPIRHIAAPVDTSTNSTSTNSTSTNSTCTNSTCTSKTSSTNASTTSTISSSNSTSTNSTCTSKTSSTNASTTSTISSSNSSRTDSNTTTTNTSRTSTNSTSAIRTSTTTSPSRTGNNTSSISTTTSTSRTNTTSSRTTSSSNSNTTTSTISSRTSSTTNATGKEQSGGKAKTKTEQSKLDEPGQRSAVSKTPAKKTAVVLPRQVVSRSPSPRPPVDPLSAPPKPSKPARPATPAVHTNARPPTPRAIPVIQAGTVSRSIARFEHKATERGKSLRSLGYSKTLNRSFSSFGWNSSSSMGTAPELPIVHARSSSALCRVRSSSALSTLQRTTQ